MAGRPSLVLALALLAAPFLAGCLAPESTLAATSAPRLTADEIEARLSKPEFAFGPYEEAWFEASDGVRLWMSLQRPDVPEGVKVPTILTITPYMTHEDLLDTPYENRIADWFVPRGYAVASVDVRGTHNSGGCLEQTGSRQAQDGYEVIEHLASQPWSNGAVGMFGISYDGETQMSVATLAPPSLKAIVPAASITSQYLWFYKAGIPYEHQWDGMTFYAPIGLAPGHAPEALAQYPQRVPCHVENHREAMRPEGEWSPYWEDRHYKDDAANVTAGTLLIHGLQDWNVKPDAVPGWWDEIEAPKRAILGQWRHAYPTRDDWWTLLHRWYDHFLLGVDTGVLNESAVWVQDSAGRWRDEAAWPPADAAPLTLYANGDALSAEPPGSGAEPAVFRDLPNSPPLGGPAKALPRLVHGVQLLGEPLEADLHVVGVPEFVIEGASDATETHWVAHLLDVDPDGVARPILRAYLNSRYWETGDPRTTPGTGADLEPGRNHTFRLETFPLDHVFEAGHRVGLWIGSDDDWVEQDTTFATNTVFRDAERATRLVLPTIERPASAFYEPEGS